MSIQTVFAHISCADLKGRLPWYENLFGKPPIRQPMPGLAEWQFTESAEVQLFEDKTNAGAGFPKPTLRLGRHRISSRREAVLVVRPLPVIEDRVFGPRDSQDLV